MFFRATCFRVLASSPKRPIDVTSSGVPPTNQCAFLSSEGPDVLATIRPQSLSDSDAVTMSAVLGSMTWPPTAPARWMRWSPRCADFTIDGVTFFPWWLKVA